MGGNDFSLRWALEIGVAFVLGVLSGKVLSMALGIFLRGAIWALFLSLVSPLMIILALLIVLYRYQKEKDDTIG